LDEQPPSRLATSSPAVTKVAEAELTSRSPAALARRGARARSQGACPALYWLEHTLLLEACAGIVALRLCAWLKVFDLPLLIICYGSEFVYFFVLIWSRLLLAFLQKLSIGFAQQ
jgi:hypothetical protein